MMHAIGYFDQLILFYIQSSLHTPLMDNVMVFMTRLGDKGIIWISLSAVMLISRRTRAVGLITLAALLLSAALGEGLIKNIVQRPRPYIAFPDVKLLVSEYASSSFPSGHTSSSFAAAYVLAVRFSKYSAIFWGVALLIAFSRLYLFMHYPTDVIAGAVLGLACGKAAVRVFRKSLKPNATKHIGKI